MEEQFLPAMRELQPPKEVPVLFLQGEKDDFNGPSGLDALRETMRKMAAPSKLVPVPGGSHSVPKASGARQDAGRRRRGGAWRHLRVRAQAPRRRRRAEGVRVNARLGVGPAPTFVVLLSASTVLFNVTPSHN